MNEPPVTLWQVLDRFRPSEILGWDLYLGVAAAGLAIWATATGRGERLIETAPVAVGMAGVTVAAVLAAIALMAAFMSPQFLRNLSTIGREPTRYIAPFLATVLVGIAASLASLLLASLSRSAPAIWIGLIGAFSAFFTTWAITSVVRGLDTMVQFVRLQAESAEIQDE